MKNPVPEHLQRNIAAYDKSAAQLAQTYNGLSSETVLPGLAERLPQPAAADGKRLRALDLGCGSGRDAFWLAARGFDVVGLDASAQMLKHARRDHGHDNIRYLRDHLPELDKLRQSERKRGKNAGFDVFVLSAVWMHLKQEERIVLMAHMAGLARKGAIAYISLRHGEAPEDRPMFVNDADQVKNLGALFGATFEHIGGDTDRQGRGGVRWEYAALRF